MADMLVETLSLTSSEKAGLGKGLNRLKSVSTFLSDAIEAFKNTTFAAAVAEAAPWAELVGRTAAETVPPVKFAIELFEKLSKENDPQVLGYLACTLAYERAIEQTVTGMEAPIVSAKEKEELQKKISRSETSDKINMSVFSFGNALAHEFIKTSDAVLWDYARAVGYSDVQVRQLINGVHIRFVGNLKTLISHGQLKERFEPFTQLMELGTGEQQAYEALLTHAEYQRWQFEEDPVFKKEPFALIHIYVETEAGKLKWSEINSPAEPDKGGAREKVDPFSEQFGGRHDLITTVMELIGDQNFREAIVVQGVAGSGKSAFTLRLCSELIKEGLRPIRVRLRDLQLDKHVSERLPEAVLLSDKGRSPNGLSHFSVDDLFLGGDIFKEETTFRGARISPYVLILDGWDEISISATEGFKVRVSKMLEEIRSQYLSNRGLAIRVILTGRPSTAVSESNFLRDKTPILTIRPLRPEQLEKFVADLTWAVRHKPIKLELNESDQWTVPELKHFKTVFERYRKDYEAITQHPAEKYTPGSMVVLGLPLLAFLAVRLMSQWKGDLSILTENPTTLYRVLVDMTCEKAGRPADDPAEIEGNRARVTGTDLRQLLHRTASAMTVFGEEAISYTELALRLNYQGEELDHRASEATQDNVLTSLMISFYFKGGHPQLGCEFLHKSFREYLFAEGIVEALKDYGRKQKRILDERGPYWRDFIGGSDDHRYEFSRRLAELLAPQWLSPEVSAHLERLVPWEINRTSQSDNANGIGSPTDPLSLHEWEHIRDGLADIWDWWAEGVHLRPQPTSEKLRRTIEFQRPYSQELVELSAPLDTSQVVGFPEPSRVITMDAHLGDGLICLCALVHYGIAVRTNWLGPDDDHESKLTPSEIWNGVSLTGQGPRRYQSLVKRGNKSWVLFAPAGQDVSYFAGYCHRINAGGWRPSGDFPFGANLSGVDLRGASIQPAVPRRAPRTTTWTHANLSYTECSGGCFYYHDMREVFAQETSFFMALLKGTDFSGAILTDARFDRAVAEGAIFNGVDISSVSGLDHQKRNLDDKSAPERRAPRLREKR